jgi:signal transduction histidine kinase/ActR/RegA family two-component response regulator
MNHRHARTLAGLAALAAVYWAAAQLGFSLAFTVRQVSTVWPPTGIALAALVRFGPRCWPGVAAGAFLANLTSGELAWTAAGVAVGNTLEAVVGARLLARLGFDPAVERVRDVLALVVTAAVATPISATIGVASLSASGLIPPGAGPLATWIIWWVGDAMGALLVTPLLLTLAAPPRTPSVRGWEPLALMAAVVGVAAPLFLRAAPEGSAAPPLEYLVFPLVIWAALSFGPREVIVSVALISAFAISGAIRGRGPFATGDLDTRLTLLQAFLAILIVTGLAMGALVTERRRAYEQMRRANATKDEFLAVLSHELRTPLTPILGWTRLLRDGELDDANRAHALAVIERNTRLQVRLVEDLLDASRIVSGKMTFERALLDVGRLVAAAHDVVREAAATRSVLLGLELPVAPALVWGDAQRLQQAVVNVLGNAIKFTPEGGRADVRVRARGREVTVTVTDTGEGVDPSFLPSMFTAFTQFDTGTTRFHGGLGLGLSIVRYILERHGGSVSAASEGQGHGTTVTLRLLAAEAATASAPDGSAAPLAGCLADVRVLVVDDDADARELMSEILRFSGAVVRAAAGPEEALVTIDAWAPDLLVSDLAMPGGDGLGLLAAARAMLEPRGRRLPALMLSAHAGSEERRRALEAGYDAHLAKPVPPAELLSTLAALVGGKKQERS